MLSPARATNLRLRPAKQHCPSCPCKYVPGFSSGGRNALFRESLLVSGWLGPAMSIRAQIARDLKCDERDEESHHHCSERNRAEAGSEESERYEQAYDAQTQAEDRPENTPRRCVLNNACAQVHRRAGRRRQLPIAAGHAQSHGDYRFAQDDYRKQCEALGDVARVEWHASDEARTDQGGNSQVDRQPDPPQQKTPWLGNG